MIHSGIGYDFHRLSVGRPFYLAGVRVPSDRGPLGHSDGDPLCHALADAVLGAAAAGDIGQHFPDDEPAYRGMPGLEILARAAAIAAALGFVVRQADTVVVCQKPKLYPFRDEIRDNLARTLALPPGLVNVKFKTTEGLGPLGRSLAVSAFATANLEKSS